MSLWPKAASFVGVGGGGGGLGACPHRNLRDLQYIFCAL